MIVYLMLSSCQEPSNKNITATLFGEGIISTAAPEFATTLNAELNQVYFNRTSADRSTMKIMFSTYDNLNWSEAKPMAFSTGLYRDVDPFFKRRCEKAIL